MTQNRTPERDCNDRTCADECATEFARRVHAASLAILRNEYALRLLVTGYPPEGASTEVPVHHLVAHAAVFSVQAADDAIVRAQQTPTPRAPDVCASAEEARCENAPSAPADFCTARQGGPSTTSTKLPIDRLCDAFRGVPGVRISRQRPCGQFTSHWVDISWGRGAVVVRWSPEDGFTAYPWPSDVSGDESRAARRANVEDVISLVFRRMRYAL